MRVAMIITTRFFPDPTVAAVRVSQWARWLPDFGWRPVVVARHYGFDASRDQLDRHVHPDLRLHYVGPRGREPVQRAGDSRPTFRERLSTSALKKLAVPDPGIRFWRAARHEVEALVRQERPNVIITSSPPHSVHDIGWWLKSRFPALPWLADFRDPYRIDPRYGPAGLASIVAPWHARFERRIHETADMITTAIPLHARWSTRHFPHGAPVRVLLNGTPMELADGSFVEKVRERTARRSVRSVGVAGAAECLTLGHAMKRLNDRGEDLDVRFVGPVPGSSAELEQVLGDRVTFSGPVSHPDAVAEIAGAGLLVALLSESRAETLCVSSKLFEYLSVPAPVLIVNPSRSDRRVFGGLPGTFTAVRPSVEDLASLLERALAEPTERLEARAADVRNRWNRRKQAALLATWLDTLVPGALLGQPR